MNHRNSPVQNLYRFEFVVFKKVLWLSVLEDTKRLPHACLMKKVFAALAALAMMAAVVSCEYDSPDIRFQQTTTITNDYSEVVKALLDQTLALSKKWNSWRTP